MRELLARPSGTVGGASVVGRTAEEEEASLMLMIDVEQRVANWTALPPDHLEGWQLQHGFAGSDAALHTDLLTDRLATEDYQRYRSATVLLFLGDGDSPAAADSAAGSGSSRNWSLVFPMARGGAWRGSAVPFEYKAIHEQGKQVEERLRASQVGRRGPPGEVLKLHINTPRAYGSSSSNGQGFCDGSAQAGLTLTGFPKGSALLIWNMLTDGSTPDASAAHLFCRGDTQASHPWIATTWLHNMPYGQDSAMALASVCEDTNPACSMWAAQGFCDDAPGQMIGLRGMCRRSCQDCQSCESLRPVRAAAGAEPQVAASSSDAGTRAAAAAAPMPSLKAYMDCVYGNMRSRRQEWSERARGAGVRKARNVIRRDMRFQAAAGIAGGHASPSQQQSSWANVW